MPKKQHISRLSAPKTWPISRKRIKWVSKPSPGPHSLDDSIPLVLVLRDVLGVVSTAKEGKQLLNASEVFVNNKVVKKPKFPLGLFDVFSINSLTKYYRIVLDSRGRLSCLEIPKKEADILLLRIAGKSTQSEGKIQLNFTNGWNLVVKKDNYSTNDVVVFNTKKRKIVKKLSLKKKACIYLIGGKYAGTLANLQNIRETGKLRKHKTVQLKVSSKKEIKSSLRNAFVVGLKEPVVKLD